MKLSVSIPDEDIEFLDEYGRRGGFPSRSAVLQRAVHLLRNEGLADDYAAAIVEWSDSDDGRAWDSTSGDGVIRAPR
ncbi:ribbon-helix-helix domain-containing protein [Nocardioides panacihumi]